MSKDTKTPAPITDAERRKRQEEVNFARANVGLEGFKPSEEAEQRAARFIAGEIELSEFVEPKPKWTQDEAIDFECACDVITDLRAILTGRIAEEGSKEHPDAERVAALRAERSRLFRERAGLHVKDHDAIARVLTEYGTRVRAWRAGTSDPSY